MTRLTSRLLAYRRIKRALPAGLLTLRNWYDGERELSYARVSFNSQNLIVDFSMDAPTLHPHISQ